MDRSEAGITGECPSCKTPAACRAHEECLAPPTPAEQASGELLPLPKVMQQWAASLRQEAEDYARANVERALAESRETIDRWRKDSMDSNMDYLVLRERLDKSEARAERLAGALLRYGRHEHDCDCRHDSAYKPRPTCTCGFDAALTDQETT